MAISVVRLDKPYGFFLVVVVVSWGEFVDPPTASKQPCFFSPSPYMCLAHHKPWSTLVDFPPKKKSRIAIRGCLYVKTYQYAR